MSQTDQKNSKDERLQEASNGVVGPLPEKELNPNLGSARVVNNNATLSALRRETRQLTDIMGAVLEEVVSAPLSASLKPVNRSAVPLKAQVEQELSSDERLSKVSEFTPSVAANASLASAGENRADMQSDATLETDDNFEGQPKLPPTELAKLGLFSRALPSKPVVNEASSTDTQDLSEKSSASSSLSMSKGDN